MSHPELLVYAQTIYRPRRAIGWLRSILRHIEAVVVLALLICLSAGGFYVIGVTIGAGFRLGWALVGRLV